MGATASIQRPELKYVSQKSALIQGYDIETINFVKNELEKNKDASDLATRDARIEEIKLLRQKFRQLYINGVKHKHIIRNDDSHVEYKPSDYQFEIAGKGTIKEEIKSAKKMIKTYYKTEKEIVDDTVVLQPPNYIFSEPKNSANVVYIGEENIKRSGDPDVGVCVYEEENQIPSARTYNNIETDVVNGINGNGDNLNGRSYYELFLVRQVVIQPFSPPRQQNIDSQETFVTNTEKVDLMKKKNDNAKCNPANQMFILITDEDVRTNKLALPKVLLSSDFHKALPDLRDHLMNRWSLDATVLKYYPDSDGNGRRILGTYIYTIWMSTQYIHTYIYNKWHQHNK